MSYSKTLMKETLRHCRHDVSAGEGSIPEYCPIAYIAQEDALFYNNTLY